MKEKEFAERLERYFKMASLLCSCCGELITVHDDRGNITERPEDYGIYTREDFEMEMKKEMEWVMNNKAMVMSILPKLQKKWPESCNAIRVVLSMAKIHYN
jgi:hypothetical protein